MPPKKRSAKKGGRTHMTEEERVVYMEQQRLAEEEKRKQKEDFVKSLIKDRMDKEEKATRLNLNKLNFQWRNIQREAKSKELRKEIEILSQTFERIVDRKESVIKSLSRDLLESEEQYSMAFRHHTQNVDHYIGLQSDRLQTLREEFNQELEIVRAEFDSELELLEEMHRREMQALNDIHFAMDIEFQEKDDNMRSEYQSARDELKNKSLEEKHAMRVNLELAVENIWSQFKAALKSYEEATNKRKKQYEELRNKDRESSKTIEQQTHRLQKLSEQIIQIKTRMAQSGKEHEERNREIKIDKERVVFHFQDLKAQLAKLRAINHKNLGILTVQAEEAVAELRRVVEKGERVLRAAEIARKLETEEEKVLPFFASSLSPDEQNDVDQAVREKAQEPFTEIMHNYTTLENFWKRFNKVNLDQLALEKQHEQLEHENRQLRQLLKQYLDGISVHDEVLSRNNPLFVVNQRSLPLGNMQRDSRVEPASKVVIEAATHVKHIQLPN